MRIAAIFLSLLGLCAGLQSKAQARVSINAVKSAILRQLGLTNDGPFEGLIKMLAGEAADQFQAHVTRCEQGACQTAVHQMPPEGLFEVVTSVAQVMQQRARELQQERERQQQMEMENTAQMWRAMGEKSTASQLAAFLNDMFMQDEMLAGQVQEGAHSRSESHVTQMVNGRSVSKHVICENGECQETTVTAASEPNDGQEDMLYMMDPLSSVPALAAVSRMPRALQKRRDDDAQVDLRAVGSGAKIGMDQGASVYAGDGKSHPEGPFASVTLLPPVAPQGNRFIEIQKIGTEIAHQKIGTDQGASVYAGDGKAHPEGPFAHVTTIDANQKVGADQGASVYRGDGEAHPEGPFAHVTMTDDYDSSGDEDVTEEEPAKPTDEDTVQGSAEVRMEAQAAGITYDNGASVYPGQGEEPFSGGLHASVGIGGESSGVQPGTVFDFSGPESAEPAAARRLAASELESEAALEQMMLLNAKLGD